MEAGVRQQLRQALTRVHQRYASLVTHPDAQIDEQPTRFLNRYKIYRVEHFVPPAFTLFYVGFEPGRQTYLLTGSPENYVELAQADGVVIDTPELATDYVTVCLEVTRSMSELFYTVQSIDEVKFRPNLEADEEAARAAMIQRYGTEITPPRVAAQNGSFAVTLFVVREQALERHVVRVSRGGELTSTVDILAAGLPLVYGL